MPRVLQLPGQVVVGDDEGAEESGAHGMKVGVAVGAVDGGGKFGVQRDGAADGIEREIGSVGDALNFNLIELACVLAGGRERAADAGEGVEVGVVETVVAGDGSVAGIVGVPRTEGASGGDFAFGFCEEPDFQGYLTLAPSCCDIPICARD